MQGQGSAVKDWRALPGGCHSIFGENAGAGQCSKKLASGTAGGLPSYLWQNAGARQCRKKIWRALPLGGYPSIFGKNAGAGCSKKLERAFGKMQGQGSAVKNWRALPLGATLYLWENLSKLKGHALGVHVDRADRGTVGGYAPGVRWYSTGGTVVRYGGVRWYGTGVRSVGTAVRYGGYGGTIRGYARGVRWCGTGGTVGCVFRRFGCVFSKLVVFFGYGAVVQYGGAVVQYGGTLYRGTVVRYGGYGGTVRGVRWYGSGGYGGTVHGARTPHHCTTSTVPPYPCSAPTVPLHRPCSDTHVVPTRFPFPERP